MEDREFSGINVVPLVDIMLVLLTITLITATFVVQREMSVDLPTAEGGGSRKTYKALSITINREGKIFIKGKEITLQKLTKALRPIDRKTPINIRSDKDTRVQSLVDVMDLLTRLRFEKVNLIVKKDGN